MDSFIQSQVEELLGKRVLKFSSASGGCIAQSFIVTFEDKSKCFIKTMPEIFSKNFQMLKSEALGLKEISKSKAIHAPTPLACNNHVLILPFIELGRPNKAFWYLFGQQLAELHRYQAKEYGFYADNFIGTTFQKNTFYSSWPDFFWKQRLCFQFYLLESKSMVDSELRKGFAVLESCIEELIGEPEGPSLLHGDLWRGNYLCSLEGTPVLIDPAVYYGDREVDLAMSRLFGGFAPEFYQAYEEAYPLRKGAEDRVDIYNLYHIFNHINLFGLSYYGQALSLIRKYIV